MRPGDAAGVLGWQALAPKAPGEINSLEAKSAGGTILQPTLPPGTSCCRESGLFLSGHLALTIRWTEDVLHQRLQLGSRIASQGCLATCSGQRARSFDRMIEPTVKQKERSRVVIMLYGAGENRGWFWGESRPAAVCMADASGIQSLESLPRCHGSRGKMGR